MRPSRLAHSPHKTLRAQGDVPHTFGTLLTPLALLLMAGGGYQVERMIAHPLESDAAVILFGSVALACGLLLSLYLLRAVRVSAPPQASELGQESKIAITRPRRQSVISLTKEAPSPRPFHRYYVDGARISR